MNTKLKSILIAFLFFSEVIFGFPCCAKPANEREPAKTVQQYQLVEYDLAIPEKYKNPYDADEVAVDMLISVPDGSTITLPCFYFQEYRAADARKITLESTGRSGWKARFTPHLKGSYNMKVVITDKDGKKEGQKFKLKVTEGSKPGFIRKSTDRYFLFDNGTPFFPIGFNISHPGKDAPLDFEYYFKKFKDNNMNYSRVWLAPPWGSFTLALEWTDKTYPTQKGNLGLKRYNQENAFRIDELLQLADKYGIYLMLCFGDEREWEENTPANREFWSTNPYNAANGGPCVRSADFFKNQEPKNIYKNKLRYLIARWGAYPNVFSWEFWNEIDHVKWCGDWSIVKNDLVSWHNEMGNYLKVNDPFKHPVSTSFCIDNNRPEIWNLPSIGYSQIHTYGGDDNMALQVVKQVAEMRSIVPDKPVFVSEYGTKSTGVAIESESERQALHNSIWAATIGGTAGTAMWWWWTSIDKINVYPSYNVLSGFVKEIPWKEVKPAPVSSSNNNVLALGLASSKSCWLWVQNKSHNWKNLESATPVLPVKNCIVTIPGLPDGKYKVTEFDTYTGNYGKTVILKSTAKKIELNIDEIAKDKAYVIKPD